MFCAIDHKHTERTCPSRPKTVRIEVGIEAAGAEWAMTSRLGSALANLTGRALLQKGLDSGAGGLVWDPGVGKDREHKGVLSCALLVAVSKQT